MATLRNLLIPLIVLSSVTSNASGNLVMSLTGTPSQSVVQVSISGTGTWGSTAISFLGAGNGWSGDFATLPQTTLTQASIVSGSLNIDNNGTLEPLDRLFVDSPGTGAFDDFVLFAASPFTTVVGEPYSFSGTGVFDLADLEPSWTFDTLVSGTYTSYGLNIALGGAADISMPEITLKISRVPELSAFLYLGLTTLTVFFARGVPRMLCLFRSRHSHV